MKLFGGLSFPLGKRGRAGISRKGRPWAGGSVGGEVPGLYAGVLAGGGGKRLASSHNSENLAAPSLVDVKSILVTPGPGGGAVVRFDMSDGSHFAASLTPDGVKVLREGLNGS